MTEPPKRVNWVMEMHNCMIPRILDILYEQVCIDVKERQKLNIQEGVSFAVDDLRAENQTFVVRKVSVSESSGDVATMGEVKFRCTKHSIIAAKSGSDLTITRQWNPDTTSCEYFADGKRVEPWQISSEALNALFFL